MINCPICKAENSESAKFCNQCGHKLENLFKTCPNERCKRSDLPKDASFCPDCGTKLEFSKSNYLDSSPVLHGFLASSVFRPTPSIGFKNNFVDYAETANGVSFKMIAVKGGTFQMGCNDGYDNEKPLHSVTVGDFYMGTTVVTQALWKVVMGNNPSHFKGDDLPVETVNWHDVQEFITKLNHLTKGNYRLPTEAEWEYASKGGKNNFQHTFSGGNILDEVAWYKDNSGSKTHSVAQKKANVLGIYDMTGNVWEWCLDSNRRYMNNSVINPSDHSSAGNRAVRGGGWADSGKYCRLTIRCHPQRGFYSFNVRRNDLGFRLVCN